MSDNAKYALMMLFVIVCVAILITGGDE